MSADSTTLPPSGGTAVRSILFVLAICLGTAAVHSEEKDKSAGATTLSKEEADQGFVAIFDGKTIKGWKGAIKGYVPEDGLLVCQKKGGGDIFTEEEFGDF